MKRKLSILFPSLITFVLFLVLFIIYKKLVKNNNPTSCIDVPSNHIAYITFTTIPSRVSNPWFSKNLRNTISQLGNETIILNVPDESHKGEKYLIPKTVTNLQGSNFKINKCGKDLGPITKLIPTLELQFIPDDAVIIVIDDDIKYRNLTFKRLTKSVLTHPDGVSSMCDDQVEGFKGFAFKKSIMKGITQLVIPNKCKRIDDDVIQKFIKYHKIPIYVVEYPGMASDSTNGFKICSTHDTTIHPKWEELRDDNRDKIREQCIPLLNSALSKLTPEATIGDS
tara:strand:- start:2911 stop:3756 length:846 start_codon:yes stop_codon:yes gene_type:complete